MGFMSEEDMEEGEDNNEVEEEVSVEESLEDDNDMSEGEVDLDKLAPSAMSIDQAVKTDHQWKVMVWSDPGQGKTHFAYTMPEPVCIIDTEHKADDIAHKFSDKEVRIWQPSDFDEAVQARNEALGLLSEYDSITGDKGTIVIDSMAVIWEWSQHKFIEEWYPNTAPDKVDINLQDWPKIKDYHNKTFRKPMEETPYHVCWTSTRKDDVGTAIDEDLDYTPDKPGGETNNAYKVNSIIRLHLNNNGVPVGDLQKSGHTRFKYMGLSRPTFQKHKELIEHIEEMESNGAETVQDIQDAYNLDYNVAFTEADTMRFLNND